MTISAPPGVFDILPVDSKDPWKSSLLWDSVEETMRKTCELYGFKGIRTPIFEKTELFQRGVGDGTDIVSKEMYTFMDKGERSLTLRPEGTASVARAYIENNMQNQSPYNKLYYIGPMFRYERMQAGRFRQFHQLGFEVYGNGSAEQDAEVIDLACSLYTKLGIKNLRVGINSIGDPASRAAYREALIAYLKGHYDQLSADSKNRFEKNPLRVLDSKEACDRALLKDVPNILDFLSDENKKHFERLQEILTALNIPFHVDPLLVRGLDYYNKTVFEIVSDDLGSQNVIGGGGRYDGLVKQLGGSDTACTGFATGIERILQVIVKQNALQPIASGPLLYIIPMGDESKKASMSLAHKLRLEGVAAEVDLNDRKVGKAFARADELKARFAVVIGDNELKSGTVEIKELSTQEKIPVPLDKLTAILSIENKMETNFESFCEMIKPYKSAEEADFFLKRMNKQIEATSELSEKLKKAVASMDQIIKGSENHV